MRTTAEGFLKMPITSPLGSAGDPDPRKRARPIPRRVRDAVTLMVYGKIDDPDCAPLNFIEAAKLAGIKPDVMRRYLDRADVRALLRSERRAFREAICAGNEGALQRVRDKSANSMAQVAAVRALEQIDAEVGTRPDNAMPGVTIRILNVTHTPSVPALSAPRQIIDAQLIERNRDPIFRDPTRPHVRPTEGDKE